MTNSSLAQKISSGNSDNSAKTKVPPDAVSITESKHSNIFLSQVVKHLPLSLLSPAHNNIITRTCIRVKLRIGYPSQPDQSWGEVEHPIEYVSAPRLPVIDRDASCYIDLSRLRRSVIRLMCLPSNNKMYV